jgi:hypothetical protein
MQRSIVEWTGAIHFGMLNVWRSALKRNIPLFGGQRLATPHACFKCEPHHRRHVGIAAMGAGTVQPLALAILQSPSPQIDSLMSRHHRKRIVCNWNIPVAACHRECVPIDVQLPIDATGLHSAQAQVTVRAHHARGQRLAQECVDRDGFPISAAFSGHNLVTISDHDSGDHWRLSALWPVARPHRSAASSF